MILCIYIYSDSDCGCVLYSHWIKWKCSFCGLYHNMQSFDGTFLWSLCLLARQQVVSATHIILAMNIIIHIRQTTPVMIASTVMFTVITIVSTSHHRKSHDLVSVITIVSTI